MVKLCKFVERNQKESKCKNGFVRWTTGKTFCRLTEWKRKKGVCPYDNTIKSQEISRASLQKTGQTTLDENEN